LTFGQKKEYRAPCGIRISRSSSNAKRALFPSSPYTSSRLPTTYSTYYLLPTTYYLLPTSNLPPTVHNLQPTFFHDLPPQKCNNNKERPLKRNPPRPTAHCPQSSRLLATEYRLPTSDFPPTANGPPPTIFRNAKRANLRDGEMAG